MRAYWKELVILALLIFSITQYNGRRSATLQSEEYQRQVVETRTEIDRLRKERSEKEEEKTVVEKRPDGTVITTTTKTKEKTKVDTKISVKENSKTDVVSKKATKQLEQYSIGAYRDLTRNSYTLDFGTRLPFIPVEAVVQSVNNFDSVNIGFRFRW